MRLTIIGFGNQARAWAQNLRDSGFPLKIALQAGSPSMIKAEALGFETVVIGSDDFYDSNSTYALLIPDHLHLSFIQNHAHKMKENSSVIYAHGFSVTESKLNQFYPHLNHILFAPKSIGSELRRQYEQGGKLGAVYSLEFVIQKKEQIKSEVFKLSEALGINMGPYETSFLRETQADLYSEQGLLCSLIPYAAGEMFKHLVEDGTEPELAYFECWLELKLIIIAMVDIGPEGFFDLISPNALIGSEKGYERLFNDDFKNNLKSLLTEIKSGKFNQELKATDVEAVRRKIKERWQSSPLMKTFHEINRDIK